jgi:hypothetical protein
LLLAGVVEAKLLALNLAAAAVAQGVYWLVMLGSLLALLTLLL